METIFKVGDEVYDYCNGWGYVESIDSDKGCPIICLFSESRRSYTKDGAYSHSTIKRLSFTEYDFTNGGFSQVRPLPEIEVDTLVYVYCCDIWHMRYFSHFDENGRLICFPDQKKSSETKEVVIFAENYSLTNPLENK